MPREPDFTAPLTGQGLGDVEAAFAWLDVAPEVGQSLIAELDAIRTDAQASHELVGRVRRELDGLNIVTADVMARRLGMLIGTPAKRAGAGQV